MVTPNQEAIDTFVSITGCTHSVAVQRLEAHSCDLTLAINAHFSQGDGSIVQGGPAVGAQDNDMMDLDDPLETEAEQIHSNPFSLLDPEFRNQRALFDNTAELTGHTSSASHVGEIRQLPSEIRDGNESSTRSGHRRTIVDVTDAERSHGAEVLQSVSVNNNDHFENIPSHYAHPRQSAPGLDALRDDHNDIEEEMIRAAIEASKKDVDLEMSQDLGDIGPHLRQAKHVDPELEHAVSLSLKAAEQGRSKLDGNLVSGDVGSSSSGPNKLDDLANAAEPSTRPQSKEATSSSSVQDEADELEEPQLIRHRSRSTSGTSSRGHPHQVSEGNEAHPAGVTEPNETIQNHLNGNAFSSDEWGGISSVEHDEAVMLEAAMFGGVPEQSGHNFPFAPHHLMRSASDRTWQAPRPPSPGLTAQRLIREQQDDEYLASLQADREKELKALEEERVAKEAALEEEKRKEEDARRKIEEEQELERLLAAKEASLAREPAADDENAVTLLVRLPDGSRRGRKFLRSDKLQSLFDFIDVGRGGIKPGSYRLVRPYPRQAFSDAESMLTLNELGLMSKQEALFLEPK